MCQRIWKRPCTALLLAALALAPVPEAGAQVAAGSTGRALDANQAAGSGGTNRLENQVDYRVRNELLTGNVGGLLGFQDELGYTSSGAFQGPLSSDELFQFRAQSIRSDLRRVNTPFARGGSLETGNVVFNTYATPEVSGFDRTTVVQGGVFGVNPSTPTAANAFTRRQDYSNLAGDLGGTTLGVLAVPDGGSLSISADPLRGVVRQSVGPRFSTAALTPSLPDGRVQARPGFGPRQPGSGDDAPDTGVELGKLQGLVSGQLQGTLARSNPQTVGERVAQAREQIFGESPQAPTADVEPVDNAYTRLLDQIKNNVETPPVDALDGDDAVDVRPEWMKRLTEPPESRIEAAERRLQERLERIRTGVKREDDEAREESGGARSPGRAATDREEAAAELNTLLDRLDYDVRLETLVAQREGRTATLYQSAEDDLAAGRFIKAERTYSQLRLEDAANPLGRAGLVHAQLGAGKMRAASYNLRGLFETHPELIATRYGEQLLPTGERMVWLQSELQRSIDDAGASSQTGLMMAYLGHQVESRQLVRYGLAIVREADPDDALLPLVERIWLDAPDASPAAPAPQSDLAPASK